MPGSDVELFRVLYEANYERIAAYVLRRAANPEDAADAVSETFLTAWRRLDAVPRDEQGTMWLYATARRVLGNQRRSTERRHRLRVRISQQPALESADLADVGVAADAFARLRPDDQELLALIAWDGLTHRQIGAVLGCSENAAKLRAARARQRFASEMAALNTGPTTTNEIATRPACATQTGEANE